MGIFGPNAEEEEIKRKAMEYQEQYAPETIGSDLEKEPGIERSVDPGDVAMASKAAGVAKGLGSIAMNQAKKAGVSKLMDAMPVARAAGKEGEERGLSALSESARQSAIRQPGALEKLGSSEGVKQFETSVANRKNAAEVAAQTKSEIEQGLISGSNPGPSPDLSYTANPALSGGSRVAKIRERPDSPVWKKGGESANQEAEAATLKYSTPSENMTIPQMQDKMAKSKTNDEARGWFDRIRNLRRKTITRSK